VGAIPRFCLRVPRLGRHQEVRRQVSRLLVLPCLALPRLASPRLSLPVQSTRDSGGPAFVVVVVVVAVTVAVVVELRGRECLRWSFVREIFPARGKRGCGTYVAALNAAKLLKY
jgi:hypothetical protein